MFVIKISGIKKTFFNSLQSLDISFNSLIKYD